MTSTTSVWWPRRFCRTRPGTDAVTVRPRLDTDLERCLEVARAVYDVDGYPPRGPIDVSVFLAPAQQLAAWVAEIDGDVVGHAALHDTGAAVTTAQAARYIGCDTGELALVARVFVHPSVRRTGAARQLLETAASDARRRGRRPILDVAVQLTGATKLYESAGWEHAGTVTIEIPGAPDLSCHVYVGPALNEQ